MDRVLKATPATISNSWYTDGTIADPGLTTIGIVAADGTVVVASGTATTGAGAAARTFALTTAHTADLNQLTVTWATQNFGAATTYVEVVGGYLFSLSELDAKLQTPAGFDADQKTAARILAESAVEDACGVAFVPRYHRETLSGSGLTRALLTRPRVRSVRSVSVDGTALTSTELEDVEVYAGRAVYYPSGFAYGTANVVVGYEHGYDYPPPRIAEAAALLAKHYLVRGPVDDRMTSMITEDGTFSITNWPTEVVDVVRQYGRSGVGIA